MLVGFILSAPNIPNAGKEIVEPIKPQNDVAELGNRVFTKLALLDVDLTDIPFTVIVNGVDAKELAKSVGK